MLAFGLVALLLVISPGPNGVLILKTIASNPKSSALINLVGIACATFIHGSLSIFGLSALVLQSAELFMVIKLLGAAYLFYIGFKAIKGSYQRTKSSDQQQVNSAVKGLDGSLASDIEIKKKPSKNRLMHFVTCFNEGFLTQLLNPKVSMFYLAAFPQFIGFDNPDISTAFLLVTIHAVLIISWFVLVILLVDKMKQLQQQKGSWINRWVQRVSGVVMIYFSFLVLSQR